MASRNSLSDDWEDVGDDNLSVISLPTSVDEAADAPPLTSLSVDNAEVTASQPGDAAASQVQPPTTLTPHKSTLPIRSAPPAYLPSGPTTSIPDRTPVDPAQDVLNQLFDDDTSRDVNPDFLHKTLLSLRGILDNTAQSLSVLPGIANPVREKSLGLCSLLSRQVAELIPILAGYAKVWSASPCELPLDPGLNAWLQGVRVKVLGLQAEVQHISRQNMSSFSLSYVPSLLQIWNDLDDNEKKMSDFLPIMQVDYDEFQTQNMRIPIASPVNPRPRPTIASIRTIYPPNARTTPIRRSDPIDIPQPQSQQHNTKPSDATTPPNRQPTSPPASPSPSDPLSPTSHIYVLRHELYELKDLIQRTVSRLSHTAGLSSSAAALASDISDAYSNLHTTLSLALSNHSSDWIDSYLSGGLTYAEFLGLDEDCIRDFAAQLRMTLDAMPGGGEERQGAGAQAAVPGRDGIWQWQRGWDAHLVKLETLVQVLSATLTPGKE